MPAMPREEIFNHVRETLVEALSVDADEVTEDAKLWSDLNMESIDMLDVVFRLEKTFGIKIPQDELVPRALLSNSEYVSGGKLNDRGLAALRQAMPYCDLSEFEQDPDINRITDVFTVGTIVSFVQAKLAAA